MSRLADHLELGTLVQVGPYGSGFTGVVHGVQWAGDGHVYKVVRDTTGQPVWCSGVQLQAITEEFRDTYVETDPEVLAQMPAPLPQRKGEE